MGNKNAHQEIMKKQEVSIFCSLLTSIIFQELSSELQNEVLETFKVFDVDGSHNIDKNEALKHWKSNFGKVSAKEFFNQVDFNGDGQISEEEFILFWKIVKGHGHTEEEIREELTNIKNGDLWVGFDKVPVIHTSKNSKD